MQIFLKFMFPALWCSFGSSIVVFCGFLISYLCSPVGGTARTAKATSLAMQGVMFCVVWGLIILAMQDREKREKEKERFRAEMKALRNQNYTN